MCTQTSWQNYSEHVVWSQSAHQSIIAHETGDYFEHGLEKFSLVRLLYWIARITFLTFYLQRNTAFLKCGSFYISFALYVCLHV